jgi:hypothetical protein
MRGIAVSDQGQYSNGQLQVVIHAAPDAWIFKEPLYGDLEADICGECGHVELRVKNANELLRHYVKAQPKRPD